MHDWQFIYDHISCTQKRPFILKEKHSIGGGCINYAYQITAKDGRQYFIKTNHARLEPMFQVEFDSLIELQQASKKAAVTIPLQIPQPICYGQTTNTSYLVLEKITMNSHGDQRILARALAAQHKINHTQFGWSQDNHIGSSPQKNQCSSHWLHFWREQRLLPQIEMLYEKGYKKTLAPYHQLLFDNLERLLKYHQPQASLLHGDLWSGNFAFNEQGQPVIFDPAIYYGDREADIAMTELFGGFNQSFYQAYNQAWPLETGYQQRKTLYNLYHILNHANLFGSSYLNQAINMIQKLC